MPPKLKQYLNRTILVSIPALFEDGKCRDCVLKSIETDGLWLASPQLAARLVGRDKNVPVSPPAVFVPLAQIAAMILPVPAAADAPAATQTGDDAPAATAAPKRSKTTPSKTAS